MMGQYLAEPLRNSGCAEVFLKARAMDENEPAKVLSTDAPIEAPGATQHYAEGSEEDEARPREMVQIQHMSIRSGPRGEDEG